jgi:hypothetical protein
MHTRPVVGGSSISREEDMFKSMIIADLRLILNQAESENSKVFIQDGKELFDVLAARTDEDGELIILLGEMLDR